MPGDTLAGIAIKYDLNMEDIKQTNGLYYDSDLISAYTHLKIPCSVPPSPTSFSSFRKQDLVREVDENLNSEITPILQPEPKIPISEDQAIKSGLNNNITNNEKVSDFFTAFDVKVANATKNAQQIIKEMEK